MKKISCLLAILLFTVSLHAQQDAKPIRKNALKTTFLSFITGSTKLTYERATLPQQSFEVTGGIIGVGFDKFKVNPKGGLFRAAYKFILSKPLDAAPLCGLYIRPEYAISVFDYDSKTMERCNSSMQTIMGTFGYQWGTRMLILDGFVGAGVGWGNPTELKYHHGFIERYSWLTLTFGIKFGLAF
jgi:hypothetical protein